MNVAAALLLAAAITDAPVALDTPVYGDAAGDQSTASVAYAGSVGLVVWDDDRPGGAGTWGMLVDASGAPLDDTGFRIEAGTLLPRVATNGSVFLVVWDDYSEPSIRGKRVSLDGVVLDAEALVLSADPPDGISGRHRQPDVASDGSDFLVVWKDISDAGEDVAGVRVGGDGLLLDSADIVVATGAGADRDTPAVSWDGSGYVVAWSVDAAGADGVYATRVVAGAAGAVVQLGDTQAFGRVQVASGGGTSLVVWASGGLIRGARLEADGDAPDATPLSIDAGGVNVSDPAVAFRVDDFLIAWGDERDDNDGDVYGAYVSTAGALSAPGPLVSSDDFPEAMPALAAHPGGALLAWQEGSDASYDGTDIRSALVSEAGVVGAASALSRSAQSHDEVTAAFSGEGYLVALRDGRDGLSRARSFSVATNGAAGSGSSGLHAGTSVSPAAAAHPGGALVAFSVGAQVLARVVDEDGAPLAAGVPLAAATTYQRTPAVAFDGTRHLVVWGDYQLQDSGFISFDVWAARVAPDGSVIDPGGSLLSEVLAGGAYPAVSYDGSAFVVAWAIPYFQQMVLQVARVDPDAAVLGPIEPVELGRVDSFDTTPAVVDIASGDGVSLVVWDAGYDIHIVRLSSTGAQEGFLALDGGGVRYDEPRVVFDGENFLVTYLTGGASSTVWLVRVTPEGALLDEEPTPIAVVPSGVTSYDLASDGALGSLLTYTSYDADPTWAGMRAFALPITEGGPGDACTLALDCASAHCVDGVCCESACDAGCGTCGASGLCEPIASGALCRAAHGDCDREERCDGEAVACPADGVQPDTLLCRAEASVCDAEEYCDGVDKSCPSNRSVAVSVGRVCRPASGACDLEERCAGTIDCPDDDAASTRHVCREAYCEGGMQYFAGECGESTTDCPPSNGYACAPYRCAPDGQQCDSSCDEQRPCTLAGWSCSDGRCEPPGEDAGSVAVGDAGPGGDVLPGDGGAGAGPPPACGCEATTNASGTLPGSALLALFTSLALFRRRRRRGA